MDLLVSWVPGWGDGGLQVSQIPARHTLPVHVTHTHTHTHRERERDI